LMPSRTFLVTPCSLTSSAVKTRLTDVKWQSVRGTIRITLFADALGNALIQERLRQLSVALGDEVLDQLNGAARNHSYQRR
jgi:hypothetical protein